MTNEYFDKIKKFLIEKVNPSFIIVFGSIAKGTDHKESDIDVAFYSETTFSSYDLFMISQELADLLKKEVDLVDIRKASTVFQAQIFTTGKVIFCADETLRMKMEMTALSMYAKLNEERKHILNNVYESGSVYEK